MRRFGFKFIFLTITSVVIVDQLTKQVASLNFSIACNRGIAFGVSFGNLFLYFLIILLVLYLLVLESNKVIKVGYLLVFAGGLSNLVDRLFVGCVRDFISIGFFPSFNLADSAITLGVCIIVYRLVLSEKKKWI